MANGLAAKRAAEAAVFKVQRVEIRDGWVYVDGVRTREAQPESALSQRNRDAAQRGANRRGRRRR